MCTEANTRLSSSEILSSGKVSSWSWETPHVHPVFRESSQILCLPASDILERSDMTLTRPTYRTSHMAIGSPFDSEEVVEEIILRAGSFFTRGDFSNTCMTLSIETGNVPALVSGCHRTIARKWMQLISFHCHARQSCRTRQPRDMSRSLVRHIQVFSRHGMIPTWRDRQSQRPRPHRSSPGV